MPNFQVTDEVRDEIVRDLEQMIVDAKEGRFVAYIFAAVTVDSNLARGMVVPGGAVNGLLYMSLDVAKAQLLETIGEAFTNETLVAEPGVEIEEALLATEEDIQLDALTRERLTAQGIIPETGIGGVPVREVMDTDPEGGDFPDLAPEPVVLEEPKASRKQRRPARNRKES
jgi:hypothetical protein